MARDEFGWGSFALRLLFAALLVLLTYNPHSYSFYHWALAALPDVSPEKAIAGIVLLALYYLAAPPFAGLSYAMPAEGSYLIVNKVLIELAALVVLLAFPTGRWLGLDRLVGASRHSTRPHRAHA